MKRFQSKPPASPTPAPDGFDYLFVSPSTLIVGGDTVCQKNQSVYLCHGKTLVPLTIQKALCARSTTHALHITDPLEVCIRNSHTAHCVTGTYTYPDIVTVPWTAARDLEASGGGRSSLMVTLQTTTAPRPIILKVLKSTKIGPSTVMYTVDPVVMRQNTRSRPEWMDADGTYTELDAFRSPGTSPYASVHTGTPPRSPRVLRAKDIGLERPAPQRAAPKLRQPQPPIVDSYTYTDLAPAT
ncbi:hypothetical protein SARC_00084 [Sphaeroforma arctica JP610]|uniref:Uncharacterized protein n=1 Tax=Sphaeroforma arctica JP610 TaxID=667725 RepID=A0A0L0GFM1_9EUKA|nr:hypothetical protein SARC_00084 [Sphaeroforma arctica JP610]KNC87827.1 hypothetical protein SARC_00084 [Sphaeroforma arctica JP610]|eukprot:XP_014161729.1 hypothetical protein SARC_00084 [Sphaeroforma arctica JP610]